MSALPAGAGPDPGDAPPLFTPRFFVMCGFTFTVFLSAFQLLPAAPFRIRDLGGSTFASGLFLGLLTYASAASAPFTGAITDRIGRRRSLLVASGVITLCSAGYALTSNYRVMLGLVVVHGVFWSGLLSASAAHMTSILPERRRAEGIGYWGLSSMAAIAVAPPLAFWIMPHGWVWVCVSCGLSNAAMGAIAWTLHESAPPREERRPDDPLVEWRITVLALSLFLCTFGYGVLTSFSAVYADAAGIAPKSLFLSVLAVVIIATRPLSAPLADRIGYRTVYVPALLLVALGQLLLAVLPPSTAAFGLAALVFGAGFGTAYPVFVGHVLRDVHAHRHGAAFGAILAAFDTGIGTGSSTAGWLIGRYGFTAAFGAAAALSALALPYFLVMDARLAAGRRAPGP